MYFLIGVLLLIFFSTTSYLYIRRRIKKIFGDDLGNIIRSARLENEERPKSLSSMDSVYLTKLLEDFPEINIDEFKSNSEKYILDYLHAIERKEVGGLKGKLRSLALSKIDDYKDKNIRYDNIKFHNRVLERYRKENGLAIITIGCSYEYTKIIDGSSKKIQERARLDYIYVTEYDKVDSTKKSFSINCPNCGSPYVNYKNKECSYCGTLVHPLVKNLWVLNDIKLY